MNKTRFFTVTFFSYLSKYIGIRHIADTRADALPVSYFYRARLNLGDNLAPDTMPRIVDRRKRAVIPRTIAAAAMCMLTVSATEIDFAASARSRDTHSHDMVDTSGAPPEAAVAATNNEPSGGKHHVSAQPPIGAKVEAPRAAASARRRLAVGSDGRKPPRSDPNDVDSAPDGTGTSTTNTDSSSGRCSSGEEDNGDSSASRATDCSALGGVAGSPLYHDEQSGAEGGHGSGLLDSLRSSSSEGMTPPATNGSSNGNGNSTYPSSVSSRPDENRGITRQQQRDDSDGPGHTEGVATSNNKGSSSSLLGTDHKRKNDANTMADGENLLSPRGHDPWEPYVIVAEADPVTSWEVLHQVRGVTTVQVQTFGDAETGTRYRSHDHHDVVV